MAYLISAVLAWCVSFCGFGLVCLFLLVAIHDGDGHDEEINVDLREGGREGGREVKGYA